LLMNELSTDSTFEVFFPLICHVSIFTLFLIDYNPGTFLFVGKRFLVMG